ncbi:MAG: hypothetical protein PHQ57_02005 [Candidatus Omnitrophica bacterium]|nr:hypothetical protein [Candidatus Omnitrophota bacterium]
MKKIYLKSFLFTAVLFTSLFLYSVLSAQEKPKEVGPPIQIEVVPEKEAKAQANTPVIEVLSNPQNVTLDFKEADIHNVLKIISYKSGVNIVTTPEVMGNVTVRLIDVPWETALDVLLKTYGFGYQRQGNIILVTKMENISKIQAEEPLQTEVFLLKFLDAQDAQKILIPLLSPRGRISVLYAKGQKGWQFGSFKIGKDSGGTTGALEREKAEQPKSETVSIEKTSAGDIISRKAELEGSVKSKTIVITDTASSLDRIRNVILPQIDKMPKQVLIEARLMEVNRDKLRDIGFDWGLGSITSAETSTITTDAVRKGANGLATDKAGGHILGSDFAPSIFGAKETALLGYEPYNAGAEFIFQKLTGTKMEVIIHALEEDVNTNTLSAPRVLTLDNQEASILVGYHTPILKSTVTAGSAAQGTGATVTQDLDYYQEIGIRLNVVPQVNEEGYINMIIHPSVTSSNTNVTATSVASGVTTTTSYPVIDVRETQTQILTRDGETVVIGGLLKDVKSKETIGIPFLGSIPLLGALFRRDTYDTQKVDLLIFITARLLKESEFTPEEIAKLEKQLGQERIIKAEAVAENNKKKQK